MPKKVVRSSTSSPLTKGEQKKGLWVEYDGPDGTRTAKYFEQNDRESRKFFTEQFELDNRPEILRSEDMAKTTTKKTTKNTTKKTTKKTTPKKTTTKKTTTKKTPAKKTTPKKTAKKTTAKKTPAKKTTVSPNIEGVNKPQARILEFLSKQNKAQTRKDISEGAKVDVCTLCEYIGSHKEDVRLKNDQKVCVSLLTLGYVKIATPEDENTRGVFYEITPDGRKLVP